MSKAWAQHWIKLFDGYTEELMELYAEDIRFEDVNLEVQINRDKARLRTFFTTFAKLFVEEGANVVAVARRVDTLSRYSRAKFTPILPGAKLKTKISVRR